MMRPCLNRLSKLTFRNNNYLQWIEGGCIVQVVCEENNNITREILDIYNQDFRKNLFTIAKEEIKLHLINVIVANQKQYELVYSNNVHSGTYYDFNIRIKKNRSLEEKFFRKNLIWEIAEKLEGQESEERKKIINDFILGMDDLIGIKILTQVKSDSEKIYEILNKNLDVLKMNGIEFKDFHKQPKPMKNGMDIYNIKGRYKNEYNFELQIKSQIESAWADMDHEMFYKDYDITPVRKSVQVTMNKVGKLLHEIDGLLFSIRNSKLDFAVEENKIILLRKLNEEYQSFIQDMFKVEFPFDFSRYVDFYDYMATALKCERNRISIGYVAEPNIIHAETENITKIYADLHRKNYDTLVNEVIFLSFKNMQNQDVSQSLNLKEYIDLYVDYLVNSFVINDDYIEGMTEVIFEILNYCPKVEVYINHNTFKEISEYFSTVYGVLLNKDADMEDEKHKGILRKLTLNFAFSNFGCNLELETDTLELVLDTLAELKQLRALLGEIELEIAGKDTEKLNWLKGIHNNFEHQISNLMEADGFGG